MNIDDMTREEVQAELERRGIDVSKQAERVLAAVRRARTCDRCGLPGKLLDLDTGSVCHAELWECIEALKAENERLRESDADKHQLYNIVCDELERLRGAVKYLRENVTPPAPDHPAWCWPDVWTEFERRVSGE